MLSASAFCVSAERCILAKWLERRKRTSREGTAIRLGNQSPRLTAVLFLRSICPGARTGYSRRRLVVAVFLAYEPAWHAGFIWDDEQHLTENPCIIGPLGLKEIWTTNRARICPLVQTTFWFEHAAWGLTPMPYHLVNILLFALSAVVLWQVLKRLGVLGAGLGAAIWALHPVQVESAAWITELKNTQSGLFYLLAILFFTEFVSAQREENRGPARRWYCLSLLCGALALASKSSTVILPVVLVLCAWWLDGRWRWRRALSVAPFVLLSAASSAAVGLDPGTGHRLRRGVATDMA